MSVNSWALNTLGTALSWKSSGGDYAITLTSLASAAARCGAKGNLGTFWPRRWNALLASAVGSAATNGTILELYWAPSTSATAGTENPGGATGTDAAFTTPAEYKLQLLPIGVLALSNNAGTGQQYQIFEFYPPTQYGSVEEVSATTVTG